jgi:hypothetical protein
MAKPSKYNIVLPSDGGSSLSLIDALSAKRPVLLYLTDQNHAVQKAFPFWWQNTSEMSGGILPFLMAEAFKFAISWWQFQWFFRPFWVYLQTKSGRS